MKNTSEEFAVGKNNIEWIGSNFKEHFYGTTFTPAKSYGLQTKTLEHPMLDKEILEKFKPQAVTLADVLAHLAVTDKSKWYIYYVNDSKGVLWAVSAYWFSDDGGWSVYAYSVGSPDGWRGGGRVVSREFSDIVPSDSDPLKSLTLRVEKLEKLFNPESLTTE